MRTVSIPELILLMTAMPPSCTSPCDAGAGCGLCLRLVDASECPRDPLRLPACSPATNAGDRCEGDGECGTSQLANNCANHDVYEIVDCVATWPPRSPLSPPLPPSPPVPSPAPPSPPFAPLAACDMPCDAGCGGTCLRLVNKSKCPRASSVASLPRCNHPLQLGELCEGDGECETSKVANNCEAANGWVTADVFRREACVRDQGGGWAGQLGGPMMVLGGVLALLGCLCLALVLVVRRHRCGQAGRQMMRGIRAPAPQQRAVPAEVASVKVELSADGASASSYQPPRIAEAE